MHTAIQVLPDKPMQPANKLNTKRIKRSNDKHLLPLLLFRQGELGYKNVEKRGLSRNCTDGYALDGRFGAAKKTARRLMPGYVFFDADTEPMWNRILKDSAVLKLLSYGDGEYALRGTDLEFIDWIKKNNGIIEMSSAVKVGSMIEFVSGPLKDMNGKIIKINRSRRQVQVSFGSENGIISKVWCSMEFVCSNADSYSAVKENKKEFDSANP